MPIPFPHVARAIEARLRLSPPSAAARLGESEEDWLAFLAGTRDASEARMQAWLDRLGWVLSWGPGDEVVWEPELERLRELKNQLHAAKKATPTAWTEDDDLLDIAGELVCSARFVQGEWWAVYDGRQERVSCRSDAWTRAEAMAREDGWEIDVKWGRL